MLRQLQTSDHRFHAISALISAASPEKMDRHTKLRTTSGTMNTHQQSSPLGLYKYRGDPLSSRETKKWSKQIEFSAESNQKKKKSKVGINEMYRNC